MTDDNSGLWRDRSFLFVQRDRVRFPALCLKCGDFADSDGDEYTCIYFPRLERAIGWRRSVVGIVMALSDRHSGKLRIPVCEKCSRKPKSRGNLGATLGLVSWAIAGMLFAFVTTSDAAPNDPKLIGTAIASVTLFGLGLFVILLGWGFQHGGKKWKVPYLDDDIVVFEGIKKDYLESLPPWDGKTLYDLQCGR